MKKVYFGLVALLTVAVFANCGANNNNNLNNGSVAIDPTCYLMETSSQATMYSGYNAVPTPFPAPGTATCTPSSYTGYTGFTPISGAGAFGYSGFGSAVTPTCNTGSDVVYSPSLGLGCVSATAILGNGQPIMYSLSPGTQAFLTVSTFNPTLLQYQQQYSSTSAYGGYSPYGTSGAYGGAYGAGGQNLGLTLNGQVLRVCSAIELCPTGQNCRSPFGAGSTSTLGVCYY